MTTATDRYSSVLATAALALALSGPLWALPVLETGYWNLVDGAFLALLVSAVLAAAALLLRLWGRTEAPLPPVPVSAVLLIALAAVGAVAAVNAEFPKLALIGTYQSGYGPLWHFMVALLVVTACDLQRVAWAMRVIAVVALAVTLTVSAILVYTAVTADYILLPVADFYGLIGFLLFFFPRIAERPTSWDRALTWALRVAAAALIVLSQNMTLVVILGFGLLVAGGMRVLPRVRGLVRTASDKAPNWSIVLLIVVFAALPAAVIVSGEAVLGEQSVRMRTVIADIMVGPFQQSSGVDWIIGHGWGHTQYAFFQYLHWGNMVLYADQWDFLWRDVFHSHNVVIETLYSVGVVGLLVYLAVLASVYFGAPRTLRLTALAFVLGYVLYSALWFDLAFHAPYLALALAAFASRDGEERAPVRAVPLRAVKWPATALLVGSIVLLIPLSVSYGAFSNGIYAMKPDKGGLENGAFAVAAVPDDPRGTEFVRAMLYRDVLRYVEARKALHTPENAALVGDMLDDVGRRTAADGSPELLLDGLEIFNTTAFSPDWSWAAQAAREREPLWDELARRSIDRSPYRSDMLIPYLTQLLTRQRLQDLERTVNRILAQAPNDAVGLYFLGGLLSQSPDLETKRTSLAVIAKSLNCGLEMYMPIPAQLKDTVAPYRGTGHTCADGG